MKLKNQEYEITISVDGTYTVESTDNRHYDIILNPENMKHKDLYRTFSITIDNFEDTISIALIGDYYSYDAQDCALLDGNLLTVLQNDAITQIDISKGRLILHKQLDSFGVNFGIYKMGDGYIVYGEIEIMMLDFEFNKTWTFSGRDIFVSVTGKEPFKICDDRIQLFDIEDNFYEIDFSGKLI